MSRVFIRSKFESFWQQRGALAPSSVKLVNLCPKEALRGLNSEISDRKVLFLKEIIILLLEINSLILGSKKTYKVKFYKIKI